MGYYRRDGCFETVMGIIFGIFLLSMPGAFIKGFLAEDTHWVLFYGIYWAILISLYYSFRLLRKHKKQRKIRNALCPHGVKSGQTQNLCAECVKEAEEQRRKQEEKLEQERRKSEIKARAIALKNQELARLTKIRLKHEKDLLSLSPSDFEDAVAVLYRKLGYSVEQTPFSGDFGKDIVAIKNGVKYLIECKRYQPDKRVGRPPIQKLYAAMIDEKAEGGVCVTTGKFANTAYAYVKRKNIDLVDLNKLVILMRQAFSDVQDNEPIKVMCLECGNIVHFGITEEVNEKSCRNGHTVINNITEHPLSLRSISGKVYCDKCGKEMRLIPGRYGKFWGCKGYPECRKTKKYEKREYVSGDKPPISFR